jgi:hypothetical protein
LSLAFPAARDSPLQAIKTLTRKALPEVDPRETLQENGEIDARRGLRQKHRNDGTTPFHELRKECHHLDFLPVPETFIADQDCSRSDPTDYRLQLRLPWQTRRQCQFVEPNA